MPSTPWPLRALASLFALSITGLGVHVLLADITLRTQAPRREAVVYVAMPIRAADPAPSAVVAPLGRLPALEMPDVQAVPGAASPPRPSAPVRRVAPAASVQTGAAVTEVTAVPADSAASAPTPDMTHRRPLDLSPDVMRTAARESKSAVRRVADASGRTLGDEPRSKGESIASSIAGAGKPDCIGPDEGGSLFSVFVIAYKAMREQCR